MPLRRNRPQSPDDYLATLGPEQRAALQNVRSIIQRAAPDAEEYISYNLPAFRLSGKLLIAYGAATNHCALYPGSVLRSFEKELKSYDTAKGTIRFSPERPLPASLVRKIVKARIAQHR